MVQKQKTIKDSSKHALIVARHAGFTLMTLAAACMVVEIPHHQQQEAHHQVAPTHQSSFAQAMEDAGHDPERREREETGPHFTSYNTSQRTPSRTAMF
jgi:hypothetical protein